MPTIFRALLPFILTAALAAAFTARADTTDSQWATEVVIAKQGDHCADDPSCMNRLHPAIPPVAHANPGADAGEQNLAAAAAIEELGAELADGASFPIADSEVPGFLASLSESVLEIAAAENAAQEKIGSLLSDRGRV